MPKQRIEVTGALAGYGLLILQTRIAQRVIDPSSAARGTTALDRDPCGEAAERIRALAAEVRQLLKRSTSVNEEHAAMSNEQSGMKAGRAGAKAEPTQSDLASFPRPRGRGLVEALERACTNPTNCSTN
ncbi:MAG: hypothetical protein PHO89_11180 [Methylacidiphilaceae bacterium]|nr:hypothetical protein [Candidatus Methylacidiphilaceae bacterium]